MLTISTERGDASGYLAVPASGSGPGVLVLHAWWGLTPFITGLCDRLAEEGFVALAPDLFQGKTAGTPDEAQALVQEQEADEDRIQALALASIEALRRQPSVHGDGIGVIGFSFGAAWALLLSPLKPDDIKAVVVFYGAYAPDFSTAKAAYLGHFAENDPFEPLEGVRQTEAALRDAGHEVAFHMYPGAGHWFFESDRPDAYNAEAAQLAWSRTLEFLRAELP
jgi:carboxymethylenebutenolidase